MPKSATNCNESVLADLRLEIQIEPRTLAGID